MSKEEAIKILELEKSKISYKFQPYDVESRNKWEGAYTMSINALQALSEIIEYMKDGTITWRDITDDIICDILHKYGF